MSNETNRVKPTVEQKAIHLFNEALVNISLCDFPSLSERRRKAKSLCFYQISNMKIALYELSLFDNVPLTALKNTEQFYNKVREEDARN